MVEASPATRLVVIGPGHDYFALDAEILAVACLEIFPGDSHDRRAR